MDINKDKNEFSKNPETEGVHLTPQAEKEATERRELQTEHEHVSDALKREIEMMKLDESLKPHAEEKSQKIRALADDDKLQNLVQLAKEKGVVYAVTVAKSMNDPYLLDMLHDLLAKEGYYKSFVKTK